MVDNGQRIDVNNISMFVTNTGSFAWDKTTSAAGLEFPRGSGETAVFAAGLWLGAKVGGAIRIALAEYSDEYGPGSALGGVPEDPNSPEVKVYKLNRVYSSTGARDSALADYTAGAVPRGAPPVTVQGDGSLDILGDQMLWAVYNDVDPTNHNNRAGSTPPLGVEVQQTTFAFDEPGPLANTVFIRFKILNRGGNTLDSTYAAIWSDPDLGGATDDLVGCDSTRALGFVHNAPTSDAVYGAQPPSAGFDLLKGPSVGGSPLPIGSFTKYIGGTDPNTAQQTYNYLKGLLPDGSVLVNPVTGTPTTFAVSGDPVSGLGWLDTNPSDRRMLLSSGPFAMAPGDSQEIVAAIVIGQGNDPLSSVSKMECFDDYVQAVFQSGLSRPFPAPDTSTSACPVPTNCPRPASYWASQCKTGSDLSPQQLDLIATRINNLSILFDWAPGTERAQLCATVATPEAASVRALARREFAAFMATVSAGDLGIAPSGGPAMRLIPYTRVACAGLRDTSIAELAATADTARHLVAADYLDVGPHPQALVGAPSVLRYFGGGADYSTNLFGSSLDPGSGLFHTTEIRFTGDPANAPTGQKAYRYLRSTSQPRTYLLQDFRRVPWTVWNVDDPAHPVQLNAGWLEDEATADGLWDPVPATVNPLGNREIIWPMASAYSETDTSFYFDPSRVDALSQAGQIDFQYALWPVAVDDGTGQAVPIDPGDVFRFTLGRQPSPGVDSLLLGLETRSLDDPDVQQQYDDIVQCLVAINHGQGIGPLCGDFATGALVSLASADATPGRVVVRWSLGERVSVTVQRRAPEQDWTAVGRAAPDGSGIVTYDDTDVLPGERYGYRLAVTWNGTERMLGEVWLSVPAVWQLHLGGPLPNPAGPELTVAFSLPTREPATIELLDVAGRRVIGRPVGAYGPGDHVIRLGDGRRFSPGVYLLRLSQGKRSVMRKTVVL